MPETNDERDKRLFRTYRTGRDEESREALAELYSLHWEALDWWAQVFFKTTDSGRRDLICGKIWTKLMNKETPYEERRETWVGWVKKVARSQALMFLRNEKRVKKAEHEYAKNRPQAAPEEELDPPTVKTALVAKAHAILAQLSPHLQVAWWLRHVRELSFKEIGEVMHCSTPEAWRRVHEAGLKVAEIVSRLEDKKPEK
jgi:RNA polymerase sigma factor (sigma-70 family)